MKRLFFAIIVIVLSFNAYTQNNSKQDKMMDKALTCIKNQEKDKAIFILKDLTIKYPDYVPSYLALAEIYYDEKNDEKSMEYYQKTIDIDPSYDMNSYYRLALLYKNKKEYEKSKTLLNYYISKQNNPKYKDKVIKCQEEIENIDFIINSINNPVPFSPINLGQNINDTLDQYLPFLTCDENLFFTQRADGKEDFYMSQKEDKTNDEIIPQWQKKIKMPYPFNSENNEGAGSISPDGRVIYFARCDAKTGYGSCDIYCSEKIGDKWSEAKNLGPNVNSSAWDSQPTIASDGRTLFFASNRKSGYGQSDIYYTYKQKNGQWTEAKNLGPTINTPGKEMSPFIHPSNTTLYFSSDYGKTMGKMDIFYSRIVDGKMTERKNIGYPINTDKDETCFIVSPNGKYAIYASNREQGYGLLDLYAFSLYKQAQPTPVIYMKGKVVYQDKKQGNQALFEIKNIKTNRLVASTVSDKVNDTYMLTLPIGEDYALSVTCDGYLFYSENFSLDKDTASLIAKSSLEKDINLIPIKEGNKIVLNNIFFATNSYELLPTSDSEIETIEQLMKNNPTIKIEISGFTDNVGKDAYNMNLSQKRAESVRQALIQKGVKEDRLVAKGYGNSKPVASNDTEQGRQKNRRTEMVIF